ncbi:MAG: hypothetical protein AABZ53_15795 [Planctomycetota bacterium]
MGTFNSTSWFVGWNDWYHLNGNTYGTWVRGDSRGWRARHHREHVDGDYKHPPPEGTYDGLRKYSESLMGKKGRAEVLLSRQAREIACRELVASLTFQGIEVLTCAVDDHHFHILARLRLPPDSTGSSAWGRDRTRHDPLYAYIRHIGGIAKSRSTFALSDSGVVPEGGVWATRFKITPIKDREHQLTVFGYIGKHIEQGAHIWTFREPVPALYKPAARDARGPEAHGL